MTKDYAKRSTNKKYDNNKTKKITLAKVILVLVIISVFVAFGLWLRTGIKHKAAMQHNLPPVETLTASHVNLSAAKKESGTDADTGMEYQFYTLLSQIKVIDPNQDGQNLPGAAPGYWLQMAVYFTEKDADAMVERLQLLGMNPDVIQRVSESSNRLLYYVVQGPYTTKAIAIQKQQNLQKLKLDSMIYEVKTADAT